MSFLTASVGKYAYVWSDTSMSPAICITIELSCATDIILQEKTTYTSHAACDFKPLVRDQAQLFVQRASTNMMKF